MDEDFIIEEIEKFAQLDYQSTSDMVDGFSSLGIDTVDNMNSYLGELGYSYVDLNGNGAYFWSRDSEVSLDGFAVFCSKSEYYYDFTYDRENNVYSCKKHRLPVTPSSKPLTIVVTDEILSEISRFSDNNEKFSFSKAEDGTVKLVRSNYLDKAQETLLTGAFNGELSFQYNDDGTVYTDENVYDYVSDKLGIDASILKSQWGFQNHSGVSMENFDTIFDFSLLGVDDDAFKLIDNVLPPSSNDYNFSLPIPEDILSILDLKIGNIYNSALRDYDHYEFLDKVNSVLETDFNESTFSDLFSSLTYEEKKKLYDETGIVVIGDHYYFDLASYFALTFDEMGFSAEDYDELLKDGQLLFKKFNFPLDVLFYLGVDIEEYNKLVSQRNEEFYKSFTRDCNTFLADDLKVKFGLNDFNAIALNYDGDSLSEKVVSSFEDYADSLFGLQYNGFNFYCDPNNEDVAGDLDTIVKKMVSSGKYNSDELGFALSLLIDSDLESFIYDNKSVSANLKEKGYSNIVFDDVKGVYKIYLQNGQYYELSENDFDLIDSEVIYDLDSITSHVDNSQSMLNLHLQNQLKGLISDDSTIDVRCTNNTYEVYINGKLYSVNRKDVEKINGEGILSLSDEELSKSILDAITSEYELESVEKLKENKKRNKHVTNKFFTPYIDYNEEYFRKISDNLLKYSVLIDDYASSLSGISFKNLPNSTAMKNSFCSSINLISLDCVSYSQKIKYILNLVTQCDNSLKDILDNMIEEFFDTNFSEVSKIGNSYNVDIDMYEKFCSEQIDYYKKQVPVYEEILKGNIQIPEDMLKEFDAYGIDYHQVEISEGVYVYFASGSSVESYVSKKEYRSFNDEYSIYDWLLESSSGSGISEELINGITVSSLAVGDLNSFKRTYDSLNAFCNLQPYLEYIFDPDYNSYLDAIKNGREPAYRSMNGTGWNPNGSDDFNWINETPPEYFTDFQKVLWYMSTEDEYRSLYDEFSNENKIDEKYYWDSGTSQNFLDDVARPFRETLNETNDSLKNIVPYSYNELAGYNEAVKAIDSWYSDGNNKIDFWDALGYDAGKFWDGFTKMASDINKLWDPETSTKEFKDFYMGKIMLDYASMTEDQINQSYSSGAMTEKEKNLRIQMRNTFEGIAPESLKASGDVANTVGIIASEVLLSYLTFGSTNLSKLGFKVSANACKNITAAIRGLANAGLTTATLYEKGYSHAAALGGGAISGIITAIISSSLSGKADTNVSKSTGIKYNWATGKITFDFNKITDPTKLDDIFTIKYNGNIPFDIPKSKFKAGLFYAGHPVIAAKQTATALQSGTNALHRGVNAGLYKFFSSHNYFLNNGLKSAFNYGSSALTQGAYSGIGNVIDDVALRIYTGDENYEITLLNGGVNMTPDKFLQSILVGEAGGGVKTSLGN